MSFDLIITSPPYNIGKSYEEHRTLNEYIKWQKAIIEKLTDCLSSNGSICWQVGNYVSNGAILPLDFVFHRIFEDLGLTLRNRIIWRFGHGLHATRRFSGRYEVVLWYTKAKSFDYTFNLDAVRVPSKYPAKRHYKGPRRGQYSGHPDGKNPSDVWDFGHDVWEIPNVKANHIEKTAHPCQLPVGLVERLVLSLSNANDLVLDPFCGVGSTGVAALSHNRRFLGVEVDRNYAAVAKARCADAANGKAQYRPHDQPLYDHTKSPLSKVPTDRTLSKD
jgi:adenine-specific DNA-methyltransferase